jgi:serine/threonine-protein kinase SRPK3
MELLGGFPRHLALSGKYSSEIFNRKGRNNNIILGELRKINKLKFWPLYDVLKEKYLYPPEEARAISNFILPMININPDQRYDLGVY